jgi:hypothetical protein
MKRMQSQVPTPSKKSKNSGDSHVSHTSMGMGDYYGTGIKAKVGKVLEDTIGLNQVPNRKLKIKPRQVV